MFTKIGEKKYRYPGVQPFKQIEQDIFYGREKDAEDLYRLINVEKEVLLYGKSGLGKSSLINAGVIPKIESEGKYIPISIRFGGYAEDKTDGPLKILNAILNNKIGLPK